MHPVFENSVRQNSVLTHFLIEVVNLTMSCPTASYVDTVEMNVKGIRQLQQNNTAEAIKCFNNGLRLVRPCLDDELPTDGCADAKPISSDRLLFSVTLADKQEALESTNNDFFAFYNRALHLSLGDIPLTGVPNVYAHLMAGVLLYNLGISHHLLAMECGDSNSFAMALDFYSMSHTTLTTDRTNTLDRHAELLNLGILAIANNVGHIHAYFRNLKETKICGVELCRRLSPLIYGQVVSEKDEDYSVFLLNMTFLSESEILCAPAA